jgi:hypothetical protein
MKFKGINDILEEGYRRISGAVFVKGNNYYVKCECGFLSPKMKISPGTKEYVCNVCKCKLTYGVKK